MGRLVSSEDILEHVPAEEIARAGRRPVYMVHTQSDHRVSFCQAEELADAALPAGVNLTTWFPAHGEHLQTPALYPEEFGRGSWASSGRRWAGRRGDGRLYHRGAQFQRERTTNTNSQCGWFFSAGLEALASFRQ